MNENNTAVATSDTSLQDGLLKFYLSCAAASDVNVERRIEREPFDYAVGWSHRLKEHLAENGHG